MSGVGCGGYGNDNWGFILFLILILLFFGSGWGHGGC